MELEKTILVEFELEDVYDKLSHTDKTELAEWLDNDGYDNKSNLEELYDNASGAKKCEVVQWLVDDDIIPSLVADICNGTRNFLDIDFDKRLLVLSENRKSLTKQQEQTIIDIAKQV